MTKGMDVAFDGEVPRFRESLLHERQHLGPEFLHAVEDFVGRRTAESEIGPRQRDETEHLGIEGDRRLDVVDTDGHVVDPGRFHRRQH